MVVGWAVVSMAVNRAADSMVQVAWAADSTAAVTVEVAAMAVVAAVVTAVEVAAVEVAVVTAVEVAVIVERMQSACEGWTHLPRCGRKSSAHIGFALKGQQ